MTRLRFTLLVIFLLCSILLGEEKPYNVNQYSWVAVPINSNESTVCGEGESTRIHKIWRLVKLKLNSLALDNAVKNGTIYEVTITWKGKEFTRTITARALKLGEQVGD